MGVGGVVAGTKGAEKGSGADNGAGEIRSATPNAKLEARGETEGDAVGTVVAPDHTVWVFAGTKGIGKDAIGNTELAKRGETVGKFGSVLLIFVALAPENVCRALNISSAFLKNILSR